MKHAVVLLALAACGDNVGGTLELSSRSDEDLRFLIDVGSGAHTANLLSSLSRLPTACPHVELGEVSTITGGCSEGDYGPVEGVAVWRGTQVSFDRFLFRGTTYHGTVEIDTTRSLATDLVTERGGLAVHAVLERTCVELDCRVDGILAVRGEGDAHLSGMLEIDGAERLVTYADETAFGPCAAWRIVGTARTGTLACAR